MKREGQRELFRRERALKARTGNETCQKAGEENVRKQKVNDPDTVTDKVRKKAKLKTELGRE